jgi:hypothetical protein
MGIFSLFGSRRRAGKHAAKPGRRAGIPDQPPSLVRTNVESPELEEVEQAAAADVARLEQDDKYFGRDAPAKQEDDL